MESTKDIEEQKEGEPSFLKLASLKDTIEIISKTGILLIGVCYVVGLLVLNLHLRTFGILHLNFLQVEYVIVGALWAFLVGFALGLIIFAVSRAKIVYERVVGGAGLFSAVNMATYAAILLFIAFGLYLISFLTDSKIRFFGVTSFYISGVILLNALGIVFLTMVIWEISYQAKQGKGQIFVAAASFRVFLFSALLLIFLSAYALYAFPHFSQAFGGGRKQKVDIVIKGDQIEAIKSIGLQIYPNTRSIGLIEIIYEADDYLIVSPPEGSQREDNTKAIRIRKDEIDAIFYLD